MKVSFDFDHTLDSAPMQRLAKAFVAMGAEVYVTTSRHSDIAHNWNADVLRICQRVGIPPDRIRFTDGELKYRFLQDFDLHFDDDDVEIGWINKHPHCGLAFKFKDTQVVGYGNSKRGNP